MANNQDIPNDGVSGFRRVVEGLTRFFGGGGPSGPLLGAGTNGPTPGLESRYLQRRYTDPMVKSRQEQARLHLAVWDNQIKPLVNRKLMEAFHPENYARMFWVMHSSSNPMLRVVNDVSVLYESPCTRSLETGDAEQPQTQPIALETGAPDVDALADVLELTGAKSSDEKTTFDRLQEAFDLDSLLDIVEKLCMVVPAVWVRPLVTYRKNEFGENDPTTGKLTFLLYTPDHADVIPSQDDPSEAQAFYYWAEEEAPNGTLRRVIHFWNPDTYVKLDSEWHELDRHPNPYKRLPVSVFRLGRPRHGYYVDGVGEDLYEATLELNVLKTLQNSRAKDSAFKQLAIQGDAKDVPQDIVLGGPTPIVLGEENTAVVLDLQSNLESFTQMWEARETSLATAHGISGAEYKKQGAPQSGFAKKLDRDQVLKESRRRRKFFAQYEQDLYNNTATTLSVNPIAEIGPLDPKARLVVDFAEPSFEEDPETQARVDALSLKMNTTSILDILRRENPDLNEVQLVRMAYRNKRINEAFMTKEQMRLTDILALGGNQETPAPEADNEEDS